MEHGLSVIEPVPYSVQEEANQFPVKANIPGSICIKIDEILASRPKDFSEVLDKLKSAGYEIKTGANIAVKEMGIKGISGFPPFRKEYREADIRAILSGVKPLENRNPFKKPVEYRTRSFDVILDLHEKIKGKGPGYEQWGKIYNLKQLSNHAVPR